MARGEKIDDDDDDDDDNDNNIWQMMSGKRGCTNFRPAEGFGVVFCRFGALTLALAFAWVLDLASTG
jgi:hypothetical protein